MGIIGGRVVQYAYLRIVDNQSSNERPATQENRKNRCLWWKSMSLLENSKELPYGFFAATDRVFLPLRLLKIDWSGHWNTWPRQAFFFIYVTRRATLGGRALRESASYLPNFFLEVGWFLFGSNWLNQQPHATYVRFYTYPVHNNSGKYPIFLRSFIFILLFTRFVF